jgi:hypothetical protein
VALLAETSMKNELEVLLFKANKTTPPPTYSAGLLPKVSTFLLVIST